MKYAQLLILGLLASCANNNNNNKQPDLKTIDCRKFTIIAPAQWKLEDSKSLDSYVRRIAIGQGDTLTFDYGYFSSSLTEHDPVILPMSYLGEMIEKKQNTEGYIFSDMPDTVNIDKIKKQNVIFDSISGFEAKIVFPRKSGIGLTGVHFRNLGNDGKGMGTTRLTLTGRNLKQTNEIDLLTAIKTISVNPVTLKP